MMKLIHNIHSKTRDSSQTFMSVCGYECQTADKIPLVLDNCKNKAVVRRAIRSRGSDNMPSALQYICSSFTCCNTAPDHIHSNEN